MSVIILIYLAQKFDDLINKGGITVLTTVKENFFTDDYEINLADQGINFAIGFSPYDSSTEPILEPAYGDLVVVRSRWGEDESGIYWTQEEVPTHTCTREELGLDPSEAGSSFFPIKKKDVPMVENHYRKMKCFNGEDIKL